MIEKVTVERYKAKDGKLYETEKEAIAHDVWTVKFNVLNDLKEIVQSSLAKNEFYSLRNTSRADGSQNWYDSGGADQFTDEVAGFIYKYWDELYVVVEQSRADHLNDQKQTQDGKL